MNEQEQWPRWIFLADGCEWLFKSLVDASRDLRVHVQLGWPILKEHLPGTGGLPVARVVRFD